MPELITETSASRRTGASGEFPLFFSSAGRPLYGAFHPANTGIGKGQVLVLCHTVGIEHMMTQRMEALVARLAANAGFAAFRYNARAHGDSAGEPRDLTFADLVEDACAAADMARELSGASRIIWLGVRFGCFIAAEAMARRDNAAALALWEPFHRGADYFRSLIRAKLITQLAKGRRPGVAPDDMMKQLERDGELPVVGAFLYSALYHSACDVDLSLSLQDWKGNTLIAQVQRRQQTTENNERLRSSIQQHGGKVTLALISQEPGWNLMPLTRPQWTSDDLLTVTREWLYGLE